MTDINDKHNQFVINNAIQNSVVASADSPKCSPRSLERNRANRPGVVRQRQNFLIDKVTAQQDGDALINLGVRQCETLLRNCHRAARFYRRRAPFLRAVLSEPNVASGSEVFTQTA